MLTKDGSRTLTSERYGETYHSTNGALTEAQHVFLDATGVKQRLKDGQPTRILEIGFGLGLNTLLSSDLASRHGTNLNYHSFENALVSAETLDELDYATLLGNPQLADILRKFVSDLHNADRQTSALDDTSMQGADLNSAERHTPSLNIAKLSAPIVHRSKSHETCPSSNNDSHATHLTRNIELTLHRRDASTVDFKQRFHHCFHAIYLDAFSPDTNSECWSPPFIARLSEALASDGKLSTYSAKGAVRRAMLAAGLKVIKLPGPPGKREMLVAHW